MQDCGGEFADGGIAQKDFQTLMEKHLSIWSASPESYKIKLPVQNIGLQVWLLLYEYLYSIGTSKNSKFMHPE